MRILALGLVCVATLCGQRKFHWQDYCFNHPAAPFCKGNDYAIKPPPRNKETGENVVTNTIGPAPQTGTPPVIVPGKIDWRFADPLADGVAWFNFSGLAASRLARTVIGQLVAKQLLFDEVTGVDEVAVSVHDGRIVVMVTGDVTDSTFAVPEPGFKVAPAPGNGMLLGHADAVDQASRRMMAGGAPADLTQGGGDCWAIASAGLAGAGPEVKRLLVTASFRDRLIGDVTVEFNEAPNTDILRLWKAKLGGGTVDGKTLHVTVSVEADEMQQKFGQIGASPLGHRLAAALTEASRHLPANDMAVPKRTRPVIYGLEGGPRVGQEPKR